jgi:C4-type Zn-finger protein
MMINCPSCQEKFEIVDEESDINIHLTCPHCQEIFEVTWLYPFTLDFIEEFSINSESSVESILD